MPSVQAPATVLATGGTGYIGAWVIQDLLERGFVVRASVRTKEGGEALLGQYPAFDGKISYVMVPDMSKDGAFDEVLKDVDAVAHVASQVVATDDPQSNEGCRLIAQNSIIGLLKSAHRNGVKRVVYTSSTGAMVGSASSRLTEPRVYDENDWNTDSIELVNSLGRDAPPHDKYMASKSIAEKEAWDYIAHNELSFDFVTVLPSYTFGPFIHYVPSKEKLGSSAGIFLDYLAPGKMKTPEQIARPISIFVDVRDVAALHSLSLLAEEAAGKRIIAANEPFSIQRICEAEPTNIEGNYILSNDVYMTLDDGIGQADPLIPNVPKGNIDAPLAKSLFTMDNRRTLEFFPRFKFRSLAESSIDAARQLQQKGWLG